jgi:hypothetical protein
MKKLKQFDSIINVLKNMPVSQKEALIKAHQEFHRLKLFCEVKKEIEILPNLSGIRVLKKTENVLALKAVVDKLKPGGFKWEDK